MHTHMAILFYFSNKGSFSIIVSKSHRHGNELCCLFYKKKQKIHTDVKLDESAFAILELLRRVY